MSRDAEGQLAGSPQGFTNCPVTPRRSNQKEKPSAPSPQELAALGPRPARRTVPVVDVLVADAAAEGSLQFPTFMKKSRELVNVALTCERQSYCVGQVAHGTKYA